MKMIALLEDKLSDQSSEYLQQLLLDRAMKVKKVNKEMNENIHVQRAQDALDLAKSPFKKIKLRWTSEIESIELELRSRNIKFNISIDDVFPEETYNSEAD